MTPRRWRTWGFCGRIQPEKGVVLALDLFARAAQTRPDLRFLLAGNTNETAHGAEIRQKISASPILSRQVTLLGKISRERLASDFYHKTGVLLFTSQWPEPFALTVVEAMSCGTYVVATATGGTPEIVDWQTGLLLADESSTPQAFAKIDTLASQPCGAMDQTLLHAQKSASRKTISIMSAKLHTLAFPL